MTTNQVIHDECIALRKEVRELREMIHELWIFHRITFFTRLACLVGHLLTKIVAGV